MVLRLQLPFIITQLDICIYMGTTKEEWSRTFRVFRDDEPRDDDLKWLEISKEDVLEHKRRPRTRFSTDLVHV